MISPNSCNSGLGFIALSQTSTTLKKDSFIMAKDEETMEQETDIIVIELGKVLTESQYGEVCASVIAFLNRRWPDFKASEFSN